MSATTTPQDSGAKILSAAAELFGERGYKATATRAIAERAGVNEVTLFRRFKNKQGILAALGEQWAESMAGFAVESMPAAEDTRGTLLALARMEVAQANRFGAAAMRLALDAHSTPEVAELMSGGPSSNHDGLAEYVAQRQAAGDIRRDLSPDIVADAFFALTSTLVMSRQLLAGTTELYGLSSDDTTDQLFALFWAGIKKRKKH